MVTLRMTPVDIGDALSTHWQRPVARVIDDAVATPGDEPVQDSQPTRQIVGWRSEEIQAVLKEEFKKYATKTYYRLQAQERDGCFSGLRWWHLVEVARWSGTSGGR